MASSLSTRVEASPPCRPASSPASPPPASLSVSSFDDLRALKARESSTFPSPPRASSSSPPRPRSLHLRHTVGASTTDPTPVSLMQPSRLKRFKRTYKTAVGVREAARKGIFSDQTSNHAPGAAQANLVILPKEHAEDFRQFCAYNAAACPLIEMTSPGQYEIATIAPGSDIRTDVPKYRVWRHGVMVDEPTDIKHLWDDSMQAFLLGCSFTWDSTLRDLGFPPRHVALGRNTPMYNTNIQLKPCGPFRGHHVVSMRPYHPEDVDAVSEITQEYPSAHGAPIQVGDPASIGISDVTSVDYGDSVPMYDGEIPVFWACGVTPQNALLHAKLPLVITHAPGFMFVADTTTEQMKDVVVPGKWSARPALEKDEGVDE